jgi:multidrug efflux pump subunit AcrB
MSIIDEAKSNWEQLLSELPTDIPIWRLERALRDISNIRADFTSYIYEYDQIDPKKITEKAIRIQLKPGPDDVLVNVGEKGVGGTYYLFEKMNLDDVVTSISENIVKEVALAFDKNKLSTKLKEIANRLELMVKPSRLAVANELEDLYIEFVRPDEEMAAKKVAKSLRAMHNNFSDVESVARKIQVDLEDGDASNVESTIDDIRYNLKSAFKNYSNYLNPR